MAVIDPPGSATAVVNPKSRTASAALQTRKPASIFSIPFITILKLSRANTAILSTAQSGRDRRDSRHGILLRAAGTARRIRRGSLRHVLRGTVRRGHGL